MEAGEGRARLPAYQSMLEWMREKYWMEEDFLWGGIDRRLTYITAIYSFDLVVRAIEATSTEKDEEYEHAVKCKDFIFHLFEGVNVKGAKVMAVRAGYPDFKEVVWPDNVNAIEVRAITHKVGMINYSKLIGRRSWAEIEFLEDMTTWAKFSGATNRHEILQ